MEKAIDLKRPQLNCRRIFKFGAFESKYQTVLAVQAIKIELNSKIQHLEVKNN